MRAKYCLFALSLAIGTLVFGLDHAGVVSAQPHTHTVVSGDTLWDICETYYQDQELWPKLWEMNPFITNPHILKPGDVIKLFEEIPARDTPAIKREPARPTIAAVDPLRGGTGLDVSEFTDVNTLGFLSGNKVEPWGHLSSDETERLFLGVGDRVYVTFKRGHQVKPGDIFTVFNRSRMLRHPLTRKDVGYSVSFLGRIVLQKEVKESFYKAEIVEGYMPISIGDPVLPFEPVSSCVQPSQPDWERLRACNRSEFPVVAVKDLHEIIGENAVVYIEQGHTQGIRRGNLLEIVGRAKPETPGDKNQPDYTLGYLLVLEARPKSATGVVISAKREFLIGTMLKPVNLNKAFKEVLIRYGDIDPKEVDMEKDMLRILVMLSRKADPKPVLSEPFHFMLGVPKCSPGPTDP